MNQCQLFCKFKCTHAKDNTGKKYVNKKYHVFHAPDKPANQEVNFDVISNVMTFLMCVLSLDSV